jgi:outer membrane receptor for ferrienterochelin and colicins
MCARTFASYRSIFAITFLIRLAFGLPAAAQAQGTATLHVDVRAGDAAVADATVKVGVLTQATGPTGRVSFERPPGPATVSVEKAGYETSISTVTLIAGSLQTLVVDLKPASVEESITVSATRTGQRLDDQPTRVEVLEREEIEEKLLMTPGDIVMMLNEMGGMRVQTTSPSIGAASIRIQGMQGRYTRFFSDGLPLFGDVGGLGLLQIPPMDLGQVEVIKGVASSLYGAGAMGGVVDLISRRPSDEAAREVLVNQSTRGATDVVGWYSSPAHEGWSMTLLGGGHFQQQNDVDDDGWADLAGYSRAVVRPRVFWDNRQGRSFFATGGFTAEDREGGGLAGGQPYVEALSTVRADAGAAGQMLVGQRYVLSMKFAAMVQDHDHQYGEVREHDRHETVFGEVTLRRAAGRHLLVGGVAFDRSAYRPADVPQFAFTYNVPGVFVQDDVQVARWLSVSASARLDHHNEYGTFVSPRVSALFRGGQWTSRVSYGLGFVGPSPLTEETEAAGLTRLVIPSRLQAERGRSTTVDVTRTHGSLSYTFTAFGSRVTDPIHVDRSMGLVMTNLEAPSTTSGVEALGTFRRGPYALTGTYTYVRARETIDAVQEVPLTPAHSAGLVGMWERRDAGRVGVEVYYTGRQTLEENPYRSASQPYVVFGLLAEKRFGRISLFVNAENLGGVRQTEWDPMVRPTRSPDGRWTVDAWAPLDGRNINGGLRFRW